MKSPSDRLKEARVLRGFTSAAQAAEAIGLNKSTYRHHENGTRDIQTEAAQRYARFFHTQPEWILYGKKPKREELSLIHI